MFLSFVSLRSLSPFSCFLFPFSTHDVRKYSASFCLILSLHTITLYYPSPLTILLPSLFLQFRLLSFFVPPSYLPLPIFIFPFLGGNNLLHLTIFFLPSYILAVSPSFLFIPTSKQTYSSSGQVREIGIKTCVATRGRAP